MKLKRLFVLAIGISAAVALVASLSVSLLLPWSTEVAVLDAPHEQVAGLSATELNDRLLSGALHLKSVRGAEKAMYVITQSPMTLVRSWAYFFVSCAVAALLCGVLVNAHRAA